MVLEDTRSIADVLKDIVGNLQQIIRAELRLAQLEVREEASKVARAGAFMAIGGLLAVFALGLVLWAGVYLLAQVVALWLATAIVGVIVGAAGGALIAAGRAQIRRVALPPKTTTTIRENVRWVKAQSN